jgi:hypothetical protein
MITWKARIKASKVKKNLMKTRIAKKRKSTMRKEIWSLDQFLCQERRSQLRKKQEAKCSSREQAIS